MFEFLQMGNHTAYVWSAYAICVVCLTALVVQSVRRSKQVEDELQSLKALSPRRRRKGGDT
jgi:heme exporter protein CcmD